METSILISRICLEPKHLDTKIKTHLLEKIKSQMVDTCTNQHGYIIKIIKIVKIIDNRISAANSDIVFTVKYEAQILKPSIGKEIEGTVCIVFNKGTFINVENKLKVLVTSESLKGYTFEPSKNIYIRGEDTIEKEDKIKVRITGVMYSKSKFSCFGELIEDE
jgi:DNA-directed RNA polymerase subunit E'/Rpb7